MQYFINTSIASTVKLQFYLKFYILELRFEMFVKLNSMFLSINSVFETKIFQIEIPS
jgi:hypothetical protein